MRDILEKITPWWDAGETFGLATVDEYVPQRAA